ncbi:MAG TPA: glycerol-3-phosphate 1-O-acyltransferase PlsY [Fimbriimonadaceae bacterium]|nr:glycerol-3-phosphate 1-O-acyltransferase PlsY [Fimbriimonadaceae bacterium]
MPWLNFAILIVAAYGVGSLPLGYWIVRRRGIDITKVGSGNPGATNVWRVCGWKLGLVVFVLDVLKGLVPALAAQQLLGRQDAAFACGFAAILGHSLSPFLGFKGGKGISTGLGALLGSSPVVALLALSAFIVVVLLTRYVSLASLVAAPAMVVAGILTGDSPILIGAYGVLALFIVFRHRANIARLIAGTEPKFGQKKNPEPGEETASNGTRESVLPEPEPVGAPTEE